MMRQRGLAILCGAACFCLGLAKLPLLFQSGLASLFTLLWLVIMALHLIANLHDLLEQFWQEQRQREAERRRRWIKAEQEWKRRQRHVIYQR